MKVQSFLVANPDGSTNAFSLFTNEENEAKPVIVFFPAMGVKATYYESFALELSKHYNVVTADLRGHGASSVRASRKVDFGYKEMLDLDYHSIIHEVNNKFPGNKIYLSGHSLGGQLACLYAAKYNHVEGLILVGCCSVYYKGFPGVKTLLGTQFLGSVASVLGYLPGKQIGFGGLEAKNVIQDWSRQSRNGKYILNNDTYDYEVALSEMKVEVLAISFETDPFAPEKAVQYLLDKFPQSNFRHLHLSKKDPLNDNFNHYSWVKKPVNTVKFITDWLQ